MNILELDSYSLGDAVKFNEKLNPRIWGADEQMRPEVRAQLLRIADDFAQSLGVTEFELRDVTVSGSNAAYTYTPHSDIDLHLVVDLPQADQSDIYRELFDAKKYQYNDQHNITIGGYDVELYVQDARQPHISQGIYSVLNDEWVQVPKRTKPTVDDISTRSKYETLSQHIEQAIDSGDYDNMVAVIDKIKRMRQAGLEQHGEFGPENLAFKMLRTQGLIKKLYDARNSAKDQQLSLDERRKKGRKKSRKSWGYFGGYWYPGTGYAGQDTPAAQAADGGGDGGAESIREDAGQTDEQILQDFVQFVVAELKLKDMPNIKLRRDPEWPKRHKTFGRYQDDLKTLEVAWGNRHIMDVLRTVAHELTHKHQHEREGERMGPDAGETGSPYENEANARAGILMRDWARLHPEHFDAGQAQGLEEAASGYIPTRKQARDPRYSMALTVDIRPGQVGKEANKLRLKTDRQGHPQIARANGLFESLMAEYQHYKEDEDLDEVKMSPSALEKFATSDAAKGIRAGFEAELIFRDTQGEAEELDPEPNYDADERAYSISQVVEFFANDEYGYGMSERQQERLYDELDERYMEWRDEQIMADFRNDAEDLIRDILLEETPMDQRIHFYLTDSLQMSDEEADAVVKAGADAPRFTNSDAQKDYADENPEYKAYLEAADEAEQELEESVEFSVNRQDEYWDEALDKYRDDYSGDDDSFFSDVGLRWMSDIANEFNLDWPVWDGGEQQNYGNRSWEDIGNSLQDAVDMPVVVSSGYHTARRRPGQWIIEPDGSLDPDDKSEEAGLEIVSPPMPLLTAIEKLKAVVDWANDPNGGNAYTNSSTGLHMGVSLPSMASEDSNDDIGIDYVKLILFLGDKYVLQQFGREANTYTASALDKLKQNIKGKKSDPAGVVKLLQHGLTELAHRELQKGVGTSKYTSAHIQPGYIEFRSPGGDWLAKADEEIGVLENTMLRFARAMQIAGDPNAERQEYAKKLYKLVTTDNEEYADQLRLFSEFSAGTINKEQLKKQWADSVLQKELPSTGKQEYEVYDSDNAQSPDGVIDTFYASNDNDAHDQYEKKYISTPKWTSTNIRIKQPWFDVFDDSGKIVKTIRAKDVDTATERAQYEFGERWTDSWTIYRRPDDTPEPKASPRAQVAKRIATKPRAPTQYNYDIIDQRTLDLKAIDRFYAANDQEASRVFDQWLKMKNLPNDTANYGYRRSAAPRETEPNVAQNFEPDLSAYERNSERINAIRAQAQEPGNWDIYQSDDPSRVVNTLIDATERQVQDWLRRQETQGMPPGFLSARRQTTTENFADGKVKGKSRPGRVKRAGASCKGSVTDLRARAKKYGGEKGKMYHWCANMKSGRKK